MSASFKGQAVQEDATDRVFKILVTDYQSTLHNIPEEQRSYLRQVRSLNSCSYYLLLRGM
jgi:hypothetical protein